MLRKRQRKSHEQKIAEEFFPVDKTDLRYSIEKPYKTKVSPQQINKKQRKFGKKRSKENISKRTQRKKVEYKSKKISLKKGGYELIITEKPQAALKIASALGEPLKKNPNRNTIPYYELSRQGKKIVVACTVGHLFTLNQNSSGSDIPVFDISWVPNYLVRKRDFTKKYHDTLLKLAKNAGSITIATDYDVEGEVIGLNATRYICGQEDANRMKFSTLTKKELEEAYKNKSKTLNWGQAIAGETRHYLDWFYGINLSRALMNAIKSLGKFKIMSIGRVQGPSLNLIVKKEEKIQNFKPKAYWQVFITIINSHRLELKYNKDIFDEKKLEKFKDLVGKTAEVSTKKTEQTLSPLPPFNLTALQMESYRIYGITPVRTLQIAQSLYLSGHISYPRTSSQKLPPSISYKEILTKLSKQYGVERLIKRQKPVEGKKTDPAHPSIYPTGQNLDGINSKNNGLSVDEQKIYDLIAKRFLALFCDDAIIDNKRITAKIDTNKRKVDGQGNLGVLTFLAKGSMIRKKSWLEFYPLKTKEQNLPDLEGEMKIISVRTEEKETQPPKRYTQASIISELEKRNLGTKATRASIIQTLYDRGYIREKSIQATYLGISLIKSLEKYSPIIIDEKLTRSFEKDMENIEKTRKDFEEKKNNVIKKAKKTITEISQDFKDNEEEIGKELVKANEKIRLREREENKLNICPVCKKGILTIIYSKKNKRQFVACDKYPECTNTYTLPPNGLIKPLTPNKICEECGFPLLMRISKGKRPWTFCFNPECPTNKERIEKYKNRKEENNNS